MVLFGRYEVGKLGVAIIATTAVIIVAEVVWALTFLFPTKLENTVVAKKPVTVSLAMSPRNINVARGEEFTLGIVLNTNGKKVSGVDALLKYDPSILQIIYAAGQNPVGEVAEPPLPIYAENKVDSSNSLVTFSALSKPKESFNGTATIGRITLRVLDTVQAKETAVWFVFRNTGASDDSNVTLAKDAEDILGEVVHSTIKIN